MATFDVTIKPKLRGALEHDVPFLKSIGVLQTPVDLKPFVNDTYLREAYGTSYDTDLAAGANPAAIKGTDEACGTEVKDAATAGEVWLTGEAATHPAAGPVCLLRNVKAYQAAGKTIRAAYIPDAVTGTRWFADKVVWVEDPSAAKDQRFKPFATQEGAQKYLGSHSGAKVVPYADAVKAA